MEAARAHRAADPAAPGTTPGTPAETPLARWAKVIDNTRCIGCHACTTACKSENQVPLSVTRTYVKYVDVGLFPATRRSFQVTRCNQCADAPCVTACPTSAMFKRADGIVDFDKSICIGCKACIAACPYDAIFINPDDHSAEKCNLCAHRIDVGLEPACVVVCPTEAILVGDLDDPGSRVAQIVNRDVVNVRRPEKETRPKLFYKGAHQATLDPLGATRPGGGLFMWSEQGSGPDHVSSGHPTRGTTSAEALLSYDIPHRMPWDWRVSMYTWTKGIAAGAYLLPLLLALTGVLPWTSPLWLWAAPIVGALFLLATAGFLIWDLEHPERFYMVLTRPQWRSWLVRGGFIITGYGVVLGLHLIATLVGATGPQRLLALVGAPLAVGSAVYTAWLFAQAKGRDLWQNPLLAPHLLVQALLLGAAGLIPVAPLMAPEALAALLLTVSGAGLLHLLLVGAEVTLPHVTAHAALASREMTRGRYGGWFAAGVALVAVGTLAPWLGSWFSVAALVGVFSHEHAYVQAGQSVPLA